jgi:hypothetical protein
LTPGLSRFTRHITNWKGPTPTVQHFEDLKFSFRGDIPTDDTFKNDFQTAVDNAKWFIQQIAVPKTINKGLLTVNRNLSESVRFRHVVFEVSVAPIY